ncbi:MAG: NAD-dependent epimerase/dehydratase family protein, partial [Candidatus Altiarchaeales archaeon]|nr:NAD-dependent epimerase/dehydratase family protein [Candidatus Altiarchaeales archaeon]
MKVLVTGGAGFIGSNIAGELVDKGFNVRVLDSLITGRRENLLDVVDKLDFVEGDIRDLNTVRRAVEGIDFVLHQAALPSVPRSIANPVLTNECNVSGTLNVLVAAKDANVKRVVYASSSSVYGDTPTLPKREDMTTTPMSPYAVSKLVGEYY